MKKLSITSIIFFLSLCLSGAREHFIYKQVSLNEGLPSLLVSFFRLQQKGIHLLLGQYLQPGGVHTADLYFTLHGSLLDGKILFFALSSISRPGKFDTPAEKLRKSPEKEQKSLDKQGKIQYTD